MTVDHVSFGRLVRSMRNGLSPATDGSFGGEVLTLSAVTHGQFDATARKLASFGQQPREEQKVRPGMFLICRGNGNAGLVGSGVVVPRDVPGELVFPDTIIGVDLDGAAVDSSYLSRAWRTPEVRSQINAGARTTNGTHKVNQQVLEAIRVPLPPLPEQRRIAAILDEADALQRKRREALGLLDDLLRSAFLEMFGDPVTNPRGWPVVAFADVTEGFRNGLSPSAEGSVAGRVLTLGAVTGAHFDPSKCKSALFDRVADDSQLATDGTFLVCRGNGNLDLVGQGQIARGAPAGTVFPDTIIACRPRRGVLDDEYLSAVWRSAAVRDQIVSGARTTNGTFKVNQQVLAAMRFPLPAIGAQREFARFASSISAHRRLADDAAAQSGGLFDSLFHRAFAGELRSHHAA